MTPRSQLTPFSQCPDHHILAVIGKGRFYRTMRAAVVVMIVWLAMGAVPLSAQQTAREARGWASSMAGFIYNLAWPTAEFEGFELGGVQQVYNGWDIAIKLNGKSAFSGESLWLRLILELRNGSLHDIRLGGDNAILSRPFATITGLAEVAAAVAEEQQRRASAGPGAPQRVATVSAATEHDRRDAANLVGTWRDENSTFTFYADGSWLCDWASGNRKTGWWTVRNDTITWHFSSGTTVSYALLWLDENAYQTRELRNGDVWNPRRVR